MTALALFASILALQTADAPQPADADAEAPPDPCRFGTAGPPAALTDLRPVVLAYAGVDVFEGAIPTHDVTDPCGLRFADLSGVWTFNGYQAVAYHDLRTGNLRMRLTHVPYDRPYFETWAMRFGYPLMDGVIGPEAADIRLALNSSYPPSVETTCPDVFRHTVEYLAIELGYDDAGQVALTVTRPQTLIDDACVQTLTEFITDTIVRTGVEGEP